MRRFALLLPIFVMACSGPSIAFQDLDEELQQARCAHLTRCQLFPDESSCRAFYRVASDPSVAAAIAAHKIDYDGERAKECVDAIAEQSCDLTARDSQRRLGACGDMFTGRIAGGDSCSFDAECASGTCELPDVCPESACCAGACRAKQSPGKADAPCARNQDCIDGLVCGQDLTCHAPEDAGGPCNADQECRDGLACVEATTDTPGTCRPLPHLGELCPFQRCAEENLRCDDDTHTCIPVGLPGAKCPTGRECAITMECDATTHVCREYPTLGMPCEGTCRGDAFCSLESSGTGACVALLANGAPCDGNQQCLSGFCEDGAIFRACIDPYVCF